MKNNKWLWWTLTILLTLVVLTGVGFAGYRFGVMRGADLTADGPAFMFQHGRGFDGGMRGFEHGGRGFNGHMDFGGRGGFGFFPFFGLFQLAVWGGLVWLGYTLFKRSGWRLSKVEASPAAAPVAEEPSATSGERKDSE